MQGVSTVYSMLVSGHLEVFDGNHLDAPAAGDDNGRRSRWGIFGTRPLRPAWAGL